MGNTVRMGKEAVESEDDISTVDVSENVYDDLAAALGEDIEEKIVSLVVPNRPTVYVRYRAVIDFDTLRAWGKKATDRKTKKLDQKNLAIIVITSTCVGVEIEKNGKKIEYLDSAGNSVTFASEKLQQMLKATLGGQYSAVTKMYGQDGHIIMVMKRILEEAGYTDIDFDEEGADPLGL